MTSIRPNMNKCFTMLAVVSGFFNSRTFCYLIIHVIRLESCHEKICFCICEYKGADQLHSNLAVDLRLCICCSSHLLWLHSLICVGPAWPEIPKIGFSHDVAHSVLSNSDKLLRDKSHNPTKTWVSQGNLLVSDLTGNFKDRFSHDVTHSSYFVTKPTIQRRLGSARATYCAV